MAQDDGAAYEAHAFDDALGTPGLHQVRGPVEWRPRETILPPDLFDRFVDDSFWRTPQPRLARIQVVLWRDRAAHDRTTSIA